MLLILPCVFLVYASCFFFFPSSSYHTVDPFFDCARPFVFSSPLLAIEVEDRGTAEKAAEVVHVVFPTFLRAAPRLIGPPSTTAVVRSAVSTAKIHPTREFHK